MTIEDLKDLRGLVATIVLAGSVREEFAAAREEMRVWCVENGFRNVEWRNIPAQLVEHGRDEACQHALTPNPAAGDPPYDWVLQIDADAAPIPPDALAQVLHTAYVTHPHADVVGAYCQLKNAPYLPTIDTGTGTWEAIYPGEGVLEVMRTGGHFLLVKTPLLQRFGPPWFRTRRTMRPIDALREIDNFSRIHCHGKNVLSGEAWERLLAEAKKQRGGGISGVGEDSGFCDAAKAVGARIFVDTNLVVGHVGTKIITPTMLKEKMDEREQALRGMLGVR